MDIAVFHQDLLGRNRQLTPQEFWLTDSLKKLYEEFPNGARGFDSAKENEELFLGVFVAALAQTQRIYPVYFIVPKARMKWTFDRIEIVTRHMFKVRKGKVEGVRAIREALRQIRATSRAVSGEEPDRWVIFGYTNSDPLLPKWAKGRLVQP